MIDFFKILMSLWITVGIFTAVPNVITIHKLLKKEVRKISDLPPGYFFCIYFFIVISFISITALIYRYI